MLILALDLSERMTGICYAPADRKPTPFLKAWRAANEGTYAAADNLALWLDELLKCYVSEKLDTQLVVCVEDYLPSGAAAGFTTSDVRDAQIALHFTVRAITTRYRSQWVLFEAASPGTIRKHFCGQASASPPRPRGSPPRTAKERADDRRATKDMVIGRAKMLGYLSGLPGDMPRPELEACADSAAIWDYAASVFARHSSTFALS